MGLCSCLLEGQLRKTAVSILTTLPKKINSLNSKDQLNLSYLKDKVIRYVSLISYITSQH